MFLLKIVSKQPLFESKPNRAKFEPSLIFPTIRSCILYAYMPTKFYTLIPYNLWDLNIQSFKKVFLPPQNVDNSLLGSKKTTSFNRYEKSLFKFVFLGELGTSPQNLMPTQGVEPWENHEFPQGVCWNSHTKATFWQKKLQMVETCSNASSICWILFFQKSLKSQFFYGISKFHLWADFCSLGSFGQKLLHWQWLRAYPKQGWNL